MNPNRSHKAISVSVLLSVGLLIFSTDLFAQLTIKWDKTHGGTGWEELQAMALTNDGGYLFGGITTTEQPSFEVSQFSKDTVSWPEPNGDFWLVKADSLGNYVWDHRYGGDRQDRMWSVYPTDDGGYLLGGESRSTVWADRTKPSRGGVDYWIVKIDGEGNVEWDEAFGGEGDDFLREAIPLPDGGFFLAGFSNSGATGDKAEASRGSSDFWVLRLNADRTIAWQKTIGGNAEDQLFDAVPTTDAGFILSGWSSSETGFDKTTPFYGLNDCWVIKLDQYGNLIWQETLGGDKEDVCQAIYPAKNGQYLFLGQSSSTKGTGNKTSEAYGQWDAWIVCLNDHGNSASKAWEESYGGALGDIAYGAVQNELGDYFVIGLSYSEADTLSLDQHVKDSPLLGASDFWVLFLDAENGEKIWEESLGGQGADAGIEIAKAHGSGYILAGHSNSMTGPYKSDPSRGANDMWVLRTGCSFPGPVLQDLPKSCKDEYVEIDATIGDSCAYCQYFWNDGITGPVRRFSPDTTTQVMVTVLHPDGCLLSDSVTIEIVPGPDSLVAGGDPVSCFGKSDAVFLVESVIGGTPPYQYSLNGDAWEDFAHYVNMSPGAYTFSILDNNECRFDTTFTISQPEEVLVDLGPDLYLDLGDSIRLQALTNLTGDYSIEWEQPEYLSCADCPAPWASPPYTSTISVRIADQNGCEARDFLRVVVEKKEGVFIPTAFSPNNDNINDYFTVYGDNAVEEVKTLKIFDRWGAKIFEASDFPPNIEQAGWDGRFGGVLAAPSIFVYFAEIKYKDGRTGFFEGEFILMQ